MNLIDIAGSKQHKIQNMKKFNPTLIKNTDRADIKISKKHTLLDNIKKEIY